VIRVQIASVKQYPVRSGRRSHRKLRREVRLSTACRGKDSDESRRKPGLGLAKHPYSVVTIRCRVRSVEPGALIASTELPWSRSGIDWEGAWSSSKLVAKQIQVAGGNTSCDPD
jgi:hypothetical protein